MAELLNLKINFLQEACKIRLKLVSQIADKYNVWKEITGDKTMTITNHDIQTVLKTYNRQLRLEQMSRRSESKKARNIEDLINISPEGRKKQQALELVAVLDKEREIEKTYTNKDED